MNENHQTQNEQESMTHEKRKEKKKEKEKERKKETIQPADDSMYLSSFCSHLLLLISSSICTTKGKEQRERWLDGRVKQSQNHELTIWTLKKKRKEGRKRNENEKEKIRSEENSSPRWGNRSEGRLGRKQPCTSAGLGLSVCLSLAGLLDSFSQLSQQLHLLLQGLRVECQFFLCLHVTQVDLAYLLDGFMS